MKLLFLCAVVKAATMLNAQTRTATENYVQRKIDEATADLDGKRDKTDLKVYGEAPDYTKAYLPDDCFPIVCSDEVYSKGDITITFYPANNPEPPYWELVIGNGRAWFQWPDGAFSYGDQMTFNGRAVRPYEWPRLSFPTSIQPTGDKLATTSTVAQVARQVVNTVWDEKLGVAWEARMHDGCLYYVAITNQPPGVK